MSSSLSTSTCSTTPTNSNRKRDALTASTLKPKVDRFLCGTTCMINDRYAPCQHRCTVMWVSPNGCTQALIDAQVIVDTYWKYLSDDMKEHFKKYKGVSPPTSPVSASRDKSTNTDINIDVYDQLVKCQHENMLMKNKIRGLEDRLTLTDQQNEFILNRAVSLKNELLVNQFRSDVEAGLIQDVGIQWPVISRPDNDIMTADEFNSFSDKYCPVVPTAPPMDPLLSASLHRHSKWVKPLVIRWPGDVRFLPWRTSKNQATTSDVITDQQNEVFTDSITDCQLSQTHAIMFKPHVVDTRWLTDPTVPPPLPVWQTPEHREFIKKMMIPPSNTEDVD